MKSSLISLALSVVCLCNAYFFSQSYYSDNQDYSVKFSTEKAEGSLEGLQGVVSFSASDLGATQINVSVDVASIRTGNKTKDKHARGSKWFNAKKYPTISFVSESVSRQGSEYQVTGTLTVKDVSQQHTIQFTAEDIDGISYLQGSTTVNRTQFNIRGNSFAFLVGEEVKVDLKVPATFNSN